MCYNLCMIRLLILVLFVFSTLNSSSFEKFDITQCKENIENENNLNPEIAKKCFIELSDQNNVNLLKKEVGNEKASKIISLNYALHDLYFHITKETNKYHYVYDLIRILEKNTFFRESECVVCDIKKFRATQKGIPPENIIWWLEKYNNPKLYHFKINTKNWGELSLKYRNNLINCSISNQIWSNKVLSEKYTIACNCINQNADKFVNLYNVISTKNNISTETLKSLESDLDFFIYSLNECSELDFEHSNLQKLIEIKNILSSKPKEQNKDNKENKTEKNIKNISKAAKDESKLDLIFDGKNQSGENKDDISYSNIKIKNVKTQNNQKNDEEKWKQIETKLKDAVLDEIKDTKAGKEILDFYSDPKNKLNFKLKDLKSQSTYGYWDPIEKELVFNKKLIEKYCNEKGIKTDQLLNDKKTLKEIAAYIGPTFVHEATHQKQTAWAQEKGVNIEYYSNGKRLTPTEIAECKKNKNCGKIEAVFPYQKEMETEAFSMDASYTAEKMLKNRDYYDKIFDNFDKKNAEIFLTKGVKGIREANDYIHIHTFAGKTAQIMKKAQEVAKEIEILKNKQNKTNDEILKLMYLEEEFNKQYKWFIETNNYIKENNSKLQSWSDELTGKILANKNKRGYEDEHY